MNRRGGEAPLDHGVGSGEAGGEVAALEAHAVRHVGRRGTRAAVVAGAPGAVRRRLRGLAGQAVGPHRRRRRGLGLFQGDRGVERPVVDLDQFRCIRAPGLVLGQDQGDRMADEDDPIAREHEHRSAIGREFGQIRRRNDGGDAGQGLRRRGVDAQHLGVRVRAGDQAGMEQPGPFEVAAVAQRALDLGFALEQLCGGADRRHVQSPPVNRTPVIGRADGTRIVGGDSTELGSEGSRALRRIGKEGAPRASAPRGSGDALGPRLARLGQAFGRWDGVGSLPEGGALRQVGVT